VCFCEHGNDFHLAKSMGKLVCFCEHGNEPSGSVKCGAFSDWLLKD